MKTAEGVRFGGPCRGEGGGDGGGDGGREGNKGGRGEEGGSAREEEAFEGFRGSEGMMECTGVDLQRERSVVGWLLAFKLSSSLPAKFGSTLDKLIPLICTSIAAQVFFALSSFGHTARVLSLSACHIPIQVVWGIPTSAGRCQVCTCHVVSFSQSVRRTGSLQLHSNTYLVPCKAISALKNEWI
jgi:hypothetical protein